MSWVYVGYEKNIIKARVPVTTDRQAVAEGVKQMVLQDLTIHCIPEWLSQALPFKDVFAQPPRQYAAYTCIEYSIEEDRKPDFTYGPICTTREDAARTFIERHGIETIEEAEALFITDVVTGFMANWFPLFNSCEHLIDVFKTAILDGLHLHPDTQEEYKQFMLHLTHEGKRDINLEAKIAYALAWVLATTGKDVNYHHVNVGSDEEQYYSTDEIRTFLQTGQLEDE